MADTYRVLITASREWTDPAVIWRFLAGCHAEAHRQGRLLVVVHGAAPGGDMIGRLYAQVMPGCEEESHPADWHGPCRDACKHGPRRRDKSGRDYCPAAGMYRNQRMVTAGADQGGAFVRAHSPGASGCARLMRKEGIPVEKFTQDD